MSEQGKYKLLADADQAFDCLQKLPVHSKLKPDVLSISQIKVQPYERDPYLLGKRLAYRDNSEMNCRGAPMLVEDIDTSRSKDKFNHHEMQNELGKPHLKDSGHKARAFAEADSANYLQSSDLKSKNRRMVEDAPSKEASPGPKTLRDLIKKSSKPSKKPGQEKVGIFNLEKELANFDFDQRLLGD